MNLLRSQFHNELMDIIQEVNMHARNEFVQQYVDIPPVPLIRMQVLFLFLYDSGVSLLEIKRYLVPTLMVQIGLDRHQEVTLTRCENEREMRAQQLRVLAGDYFSSKYYYLLAQIKEISLIRTLAQSIYKINECKTELYYNASLSTEEKLMMQNKIDSALFVSFIPKNKSEDHFWVLLMEQFIQAERLMDELLTYKLGHVMTDYFSCLVNGDTVDKAVNFLYSKVEQLLDDIKTLALKARKNEVKQEILVMTDECLRSISLQIKA
jgi:heptaprenyl diphosphate synthase